MFQVELAPLGGILGPLKSDLGVFWAKIPLYPYNVKFSNSIFSKSPNLPILSFWILNLHIINCQFQKRSTVKHFFFSHCMLLPLVWDRRIFCAYYSLRVLNMCRKWIARKREYFGSILSWVALHYAFWTSASSGNLFWSNFCCILDKQVFHHYALLSCGVWGCSSHWLWNHNRLLGISTRFLHV